MTRLEAFRALLEAGKVDGDQQPGQRVIYDKPDDAKIALRRIRHIVLPWTWQQEKAQ